MHALFYGFCCFFWFSAECFWDFVCGRLSACVYSVYAGFVLSLFPLIDKFIITIAVLPNV